MATVAIITVCTILCIAVGIPIGIVMARSNRAEKAILPVLDMMQTIPSFVYLIPILMLLGIGKVPGLIAVCVYAVPPIIRLTNLGIREVDRETIEASEAFGATTVQKLKSVQIPLALPTVFAGVNQTIMMALAMVVIASMIGVKGLGVPILRGFKPIFSTWNDEWFSNCCSSNYFRQSYTAVREADPKTQRSKKIISPVWISIFLDSYFKINKDPKNNEIFFRNWTTIDS